MYTCTLDAYEFIYVHQKLITWSIMLVQGSIKIKVHVHVFDGSSMDMI